MRFAILTLILVQNSFNIFAQTGQPTKLQDFGLFGHVKEIKTKNFLSINTDEGLSKGKLTPRELGANPIEIMKFDSMGLLKEEINYTANGSIHDFRIALFDENKKLLKYTIFKRDSSIYNEWNYKYPDSSLMVVEINYPSKKHEISKSFYRFRSDGKIKQIRTENYNSDTIVFWYQKIITHYSNMITIHGKSMDNNSASYISIMDDNGNTIESINIGDFINWRISRKFDEKSRIIEEKTFRDGEVTVETYSYKLDNYGNWILKVTEKNGNPSFITTREIIYY